MEEKEFERERIHAVFIEGRRDGYHPTQCYATMTVADLIDILNNFDSDALVYLDNDNGYTFGSIWYDSFSEGTFTEDINDDIEKW